MAPPRKYPIDSTEQQAAAPSSAFGGLTRDCDLSKMNDTQASIDEMRAELAALKRENEALRDAKATAVVALPQSAMHGAVVVLNADPFLRTFALPASGGETRRTVSIPAAKVDGFKKTTPGRAQVDRADWQAIVENPTAKALLATGTISLLVEV